MDELYVQYNHILNGVKVDRKPVREIYNAMLEYSNWYAGNAMFLPEALIKKCLVNSIRHCNSTYDKDLRQVNKIRRRIGNEGLYRRYKNVVLNHIAEEYPFLDKACEKQKLKTQLVRIVK